MASARLPVTLALLAAAALASTAGCRPGAGDAGQPPRQKRGAGGTGVAYINEATCAECHQAEHQAWTGSHHDLAMQPATAKTVLGDFGNATFTHLGVTSRFFTREGRFIVNTEGADGEHADFELTYTFGAEPLQPSTLRDGLYYPDGQIRAEVYDRRRLPGMRGLPFAPPADQPRGPARTVIP